MRLQIICMANSRKLGGRCVAGLRLDGGGWIRPVAPTPEGTLYRSTCTLNGRTEVRPLDVIEVDVARPRPDPHQPENWVLTNRRWKLLSRPGPRS